jgi:acyl carrier protein
MPDIPETVKAILARVCAIEASIIREDAQLVGYGLDSVRAVDFMVELEQTYEIQVPDEDVAKIRTLRDVTNYIRRRRGAGKGS